MSSTQQTPTAAPPRVAVPPARRGGIDWFRFWMQMLVAMLVFNIVAGIITWYFILPRLHPSQ